MIIALLGASGSGKSEIEKILSSKYGYKKIVSYTTRKPRNGEVHGKDYYFISNEQFITSLSNDVFAEYDEYSQCRLYGTAKEDYINDEDKVVVLTPNGLRQLKKNIPDSNIFSVLVESNLGTRMKRYIDRCGVDKFNFDDKNEIASRVERDYGMFLGVNKDVNFVIHNNEGADLNKVVEEIMQCVKLAK